MSANTLSPRERENLRLAALNVLDANNTERGLSLDAVTMFVGGFGFTNLEARTLKVELEYLEEKELIKLVTKVVSPENRAWKITAKGRDYLAEMGC